MEKETFLSVSYGQGTVLPEYSFVNSIADNPLCQFRLSYYKQTNGSNYWQQLYKYPKFGVSFLFSTLGNREVLGNEFAVYPFFTLKSISRQIFSLEHLIGFGLGFATKKFDLTNNYLNIAVGSHLNLHFHYGLLGNFRLTKRIYLTLGLGFDHFSNANMKEPNLGINSLAFQFTGSYRIQRAEATQKVLEVPVLTNKNEFAFIYSVGGKHTRALQSAVYFTSSASIEYNRTIGRKFHLGVGLDVFYDASTKTEMNVPGKEPYRKEYDYTTGIHLSEEFVYNRLSIILQEGIYLGLKDHLNKAFMFNRLIARYKWNEHFFTHIAMKSHLHILDYPEIGFAYYFHR